MTKIHLQANSGLRREPMAMCASRMTGQGTVMNNNRRSYVGMCSEIVRLDAFKAAPEADRCAHCCDQLLIRRNAQRREKGKNPVARYNEGWDQ
jgi:hypothetical protein